MKLPVSVMGAFIVTEDELLLPEYEPVPVPVQPPNVYPLPAVALMPTLAPLLYQPLPGLTLPPVPAFMVR